MFAYLTRGSFVLVLFALFIVGCTQTDVVDHTADKLEGPGSNLLPPDPQDWICAHTEATPAEEQAWCDANQDRGQPFDMGPPPMMADIDAKNDYDCRLQHWLHNREYAKTLGWQHDKQWRLTGPIVWENSDLDSYGVHPAVRIYYSPEAVDWLCAGRPEEGPPDGTVLVKEMYSLEKLFYTEGEDGCLTIDESRLPPENEMTWAVMIRVKNASHDGWYWAGPANFQDEADACTDNPPLLNASATATGFFAEGNNPPTAPQDNWFPTGNSFSSSVVSSVSYPYNLYGAACINCHAVAINNSTFSTLDNVMGKELRFKGFGEIPPDSTDDDSEGDRHLPGAVAARSTTPPTNPRAPFPEPYAAPSQEFLKFFNQLEPVTFQQVWATRFPAETFDHRVPRAGDQPGQFLTSDQCIACHDATYSNAADANMQFEINGQDYNLSPYGEWRASPMGLAGRDPIFFSQLQSETNNLPDLTDCIETTCLHCHGVMGQRTYAEETKEPDAPCTDLFGVTPPEGVPFGKPFRRQMVAEWEGDGALYGGLARDGISCTVCHHIADTDLGKEKSFTGNWVAGPEDELYGPFKDVVTKPMEHALGTTPLYASQIQSSDLCNSCHNILLPVFDNAGKQLRYSYEQTTGLEWQNSVFAQSGDTFQSCQDCHMPETFHLPNDDGPPTNLPPTQIANIESNEFAPTSNRLPDADITMKDRENYRRHALHGLNVYLNQMFQQFPLILGLRQKDYMVKSSVQPSLLTGAASMVEMAQNQTSDVQVLDLSKGDGKLTATVQVKNKVGHYVPSGVGFRRAFVEFLVKDASGKVLWASGATNNLGVILDGPADNPDSKPLPTEELIQNPKIWQPHYQTITSQDQVQIYQEIITDSDGNVTFSFLRRFKEEKDNRLRPDGFDFAYYIKLGEEQDSEFIKELSHPVGNVAEDPDYTDPAKTGQDTLIYDIALSADDLANAVSVEVNLYSQAIPPPYLQERFRDANRGPAKKDDIQRLYYLTSHMNVETPTANGQPYMQQWKLRIGGTTRNL